MNFRQSSLRIFAIAMLSLISSATAYEDKVKSKEVPVRGHVFGWPFLEAQKMQPRGGTTKGGDVVLSSKIKKVWQDLQQEGLIPQERDRRAILAMQGSYRVSFDFMETVGFKPNFKPQKPYFSWGTERVIVLKNEPDFISLQHVLVMYFKDKEGKQTGPHVMKHWRQDWTFEDSSIHEYQGNLTWKERQTKNSKGHWSQAVYQVDDSPRYQVLGQWEHLDGKSTWRSRDCWRPLPRREYSIRKDYNILGGRHEITISPTGWIHLQNNRKLMVTDSKIEVLSHELGLSRYEEISAPDLKAGEEAFFKAEPYWQKVRTKWDRIFQNRQTFSLRPTVEQKQRWMIHFEYAGEVEQNGWDEELGTIHAESTIDTFLKE